MMTKIAELELAALLVGMPGVQYQVFNLTVDGIQEDRKHYGPTRIADSRSRPNIVRLPKGSIDENWRMFSAISLEDLSIIQEKYELRYGKQIGKIEAGWLGPNIVVKGISSFSKLPIGTILKFDNQVELVVTAENKSCATPGKLIAQQLNLPLIEAGRFVQDADGYRGVVGTVKTPGVINPEMRIEIFCPS